MFLFRTGAKKKDQGEKSVTSEKLYSRGIWIKKFSLLCVLTL